MPRRFRHRLPWLLIGLGGALLAADVVALFETQLRLHVMLAFFIPGIIYLADAVGTQGTIDFHEWIGQGWFPWESEGYPYWGNPHHTQSWWAYRHLPNILFVHYNDLLADLAGEILRVADFLEIPLSAEALPSIMQAASLET